MPPKKQAKEDEPAPAVKRKAEEEPAAEAPFKKCKTEEDVRVLKKRINQAVQMLDLSVRIHSFSRPATPYFVPPHPATEYMPSCFQKFWRRWSRGNTCAFIDGEGQTCTQPLMEEYQSVSCYDPFYHFKACAVHRNDEKLTSAWEKDRADLEKEIESEIAIINGMRLHDVVKSNLAELRTIVYSTDALEQINSST
jgi:hypothetical protein